MEIMNPVLTHRTVFEITRVAGQMAHDGEIRIADEQKLYTDILELGLGYDNTHNEGDPHYERRLRACARAWFQMHYPAE